ncbi:MAG: CoA transferase [Acidimicrobiales bacterium]
MNNPMSGVRVLEVAMYGFVTSAGAVLADWGAEVLKVEHAETGDPQRGLRRTGSFVVEGDLNPNVEHPNRGKRSIGLDISTERGREVLFRLVEQTDVFLTSLLPSARTRFQIDVEQVRAHNPAVIYARGSALGTRGTEANRGGYDMTAFWSRAGIAASLSPKELDGVIGPPGPAFGDTIAGTNLAGGIAAALFARERTGETSVVDVSLLSSGLWAMGMAIDNSILAQRAYEAPMVGAPGSGNPLSGLYRTADDRYLSMVMLQPAKFWADVCRHVDLPDLIEDPRFATSESIVAHGSEAYTLIQQAIGSKTLAEWTERLTTLSGPWAPVQDTLQVTHDPQIRSNDYLVSTEAEDGTEYELVANAVQFDEEAPVLRRAPAFAEHTDAVLEDLGYDWDKIIELKVEGTVA